MNISLQGCKQLQGDVKKNHHNFKNIQKQSNIKRTVQKSHGFFQLFQLGITNVTDCQAHFFS